MLLVSEEEEEDDDDDDHTVIIITLFLWAKMTSSSSFSPRSVLTGGRLFAPPKTTSRKPSSSSSFASSSCRRGGGIPRRMRDSLGASTSRGELVKTRRSARENEHHHRANGKNGEKTTKMKKKTTKKKKKNATRNRAWTRDEEDVEEILEEMRLTSGLLLDDAVPMEEHEKAQGEKTTVKDDPIVQEKRIDRGLGQRRALSAETRSRPFVPLGGEVLHLAWMREYDETGKFTKEEGEAYRETITSLLSHYTTPAWKVTSVLDGVARGWSDVVLDLGAGFNCRLQRHSEFETLTLSGPGRLDDEISAPITPWSWLLPSDWLADVPGRVFLIQHFIVRLDKETFADTVDRKTLNGEWLTLNGMKDARRGMHDPSEIIADTGVISNDLALRQEEAARQALASRVMSRDSSYFEDPLTTTSSTKGASKETFRDSELDWEVGAFAAANLGDGAKIYVNYQLDEDGGTQCLVTVPPGKEAFDRAMRQIQRLTIIEQYRLLILFRLPQAKAKRQSLAQLQIQYDNVSSILRKSRASNTDYRNQQEMLTQVADLESAVADVVAKTRMLALSAQAYQQIIELKFTEAQLKRVSYSARFIPLFVKKRLDPALSTIFFASEQAEILSAALSRTTNLIQAAVEVKLQRLNESIALYGLIFTVASVGLGLLQAWRIGNVGWLVEFTKTWFLKTMAWILSNFGHLFEHFHIYGLA